MSECTQKISLSEQKDHCATREPAYQKFSPFSRVMPPSLGAWVIFVRIFHSKRETKKILTYIHGEERRAEDAFYLYFAPRIKSLKSKQVKSYGPWTVHRDEGNEKTERGSHWAFLGHGRNDLQFLQLFLFSKCFRVCALCVSTVWSNFFSQ